MSDNLDFNDAGKQKSFDVIPDNTICALHMQIRPGGVGDGGWLTRAKDGRSEHLNCVFTVVDGDYAKRKLFARLTVSGVDHADAIDINRRLQCAMLESGRGIMPNDKSPAAVEVRRVKNYGEFDHLCFMACLGVEPPKNGFAATNKIKRVITPDQQDWHKPELPAGGAPVAGAPAPAGSGVTTTPAQTPPANAITRPQWAQPEKKAE